MKACRSCWPVAVLVIGLFAALGVGAATDEAPPKMGTTADHSKFKQLQRSFASGPEVTKV